MVIESEDKWHVIDTIWLSNGEKNSMGRIEFKLQFLGEKK